MFPSPFCDPQSLRLRQMKSIYKSCITFWYFQGVHFFLMPLFLSHSEPRLVHLPVMTSDILIISKLNNTRLDLDQNVSQRKLQFLMIEMSLLVLLGSGFRFLTTETIISPLFLLSLLPECFILLYSSSTSCIFNLAIGLFPLPRKRQRPFNVDNFPV